MVDWTAELQPEKLDLPDPSVVQLVVAEETESYVGGEPLVKVTVVLAPRYGLDDVKWELVHPIDAAVTRRIRHEPGAGAPYVRFLTDEDWREELADDTDEYGNVAA